jgi:hypothetical protein
MKRTIAASFLLALAACSTQPFKPVVANVPLNMCLHAGDCDGRPYPAVTDEGLGIGSAGIE